MTKPKIIAAQFLILILCITAHADVPKQISYQGILSGSTGSPLPDSTVNVEFRIYETPTGGSSKWAETQEVTTDELGRFSVILGLSFPIEDTVFNGIDRYLSINVESNGEMPRIKLVSVAFSNRVSTVDGATGGIISGNTSIQSDLTVSGKATIGLGHTNTGIYTFVAGKDNTAFGDYSTISGGHDNTASNGGVVGGGSGNSAAGGVVSGGANNYANGGVVGGGANNNGQGISSTIGGGGNNSAYGLYSTISGGTLNTAGTIDLTGDYATVGGGYGNIADGVDATIGGGYRNKASGLGATVPGGIECEATGNHSFAAGRLSQAGLQGAFVWSDGTTGVPFSSTAPNQFLILASGGVGIGTNSPTVALEVAGDLKVSGNIIGSTPWTTFPFNFGNYDNYVDAHGGGFQRAQYRKIGDIVYLRGMIHKTDHAAIPNGAFLGTLPSGFRPPATVRFTPDPNGNSVDITSSGTVISYGPGTTADYQFIDGISFSTTP